MKPEENVSIDYYQILELSPRHSTAADIRRAYRKLALLYHPDKNQNQPEFGEKFKAIVQANDVLGDSLKKEIYDRARKRANISSSTIYSSSFSSAYATHRTSTPNKPMPYAPGSSGTGTGFAWNSTQREKYGWSHTPTSAYTSKFYRSAKPPSTPTPKAAPKASFTSFSQSARKASAYEFTSRFSKAKSTGSSATGMKSQQKQTDSTRSAPTAMKSPHTPEYPKGASGSQRERQFAKPSPKFTTRSAERRAAAATSVNSKEDQQSDAKTEPADCHNSLPCDSVNRQWQQTSESSERPSQSRKQSVHIETVNETNDDIDDGDISDRLEEDDLDIEGINIDDDIGDKKTEFSTQFASPKFNFINPDLSRQFNFGESTNMFESIQKSEENVSPFFTSRGGRTVTVETDDEEDSKIDDGRDDEDDDDDKDELTSAVNISRFAKESRLFQERVNSSTGINDINIKINDVESASKNMEAKDSFSADMWSKVLSKENPFLSAAANDMPPIKPQISLKKSKSKLKPVSNPAKDSGPSHEFRDTSTSRMESKTNSSTPLEDSSATTPTPLFSTSKKREKRRTAKSAHASKSNFTTKDAFDDFGLFNTIPPLSQNTSEFKFDDLKNSLPVSQDQSITGNFAPQNDTKYDFVNRPLSPIPLETSETSKENLAGRERHADPKLPFSRDAPMSSFISTSKQYQNDTNIIDYHDSPAVFDIEPPVAPALPANTLNPSEAELKEYWDHVLQYQQQWNIYQLKMTMYISERQEADRLNSLAILSNSSNLEKYISVLQQDENVRIKWNEALKFHKRVMISLLAVRRIAES
ncbi:hypothetical protein V1511DRAFT_510970 [Dipodascopsis uninucleata]